MSLLVERSVSVCFVFNHKEKLRWHYGKISRCVCVFGEVWSFFGRGPGNPTAAHVGRSVQNREAFLRVQLVQASRSLYLQR